MFNTGVVDTGDKLFNGVNDTGENLSPVLLTPAIKLCHGFSVIAGVVDTGEQFIAGDNNTGYNFITGDNDTGDNFIAGDNDTGDKFIAGDKNKDAMEVGSCQS
jgi:hypothetical protein